jgi:hypothetical protein
VAQLDDLEARVPPHERTQRQQDLRWAATIEKQQDLATRAPGSSVAYQVVRAYRMPAIPLDPTSLEPAGEAVTNLDQVIDHWTGHPDHAVGVRLGQQRNGELSLVAIRAAKWSTWRGWVRDNAVDERIRPWSDEDPNRGELERTGRPLGGPLILRWESPAGPPFRSYAFKGDREMREAAEAMRQRLQGKDRGGHLLWTCAADADGRLPIVKGRELSPGLAVLASTEVVPLWASLPDGSVLRQDGRVREPDPVTDLPRWLLEVFGVSKWERVR